MQSYEELGVFYLGRKHDLATDETSEELVLYDSKDLTTHAVCVGMTGSGKTGLGVVLLEEAAIDGIPIIAIDPKGDLSNMLLTFPELRPADFAPWIDEGAAAREGRTVDEHARATADLWRDGLAKTGQGPERIRRFADASERVVYTPGSRSGRPLSILRSFDAPPAALLEDEDALRDRILATTSGLLGLLGIAADPIRSREHILISNLLDRAWREGRGLDLPALIRQIQSPPMERIGVLDIDSFFPAAQRFELAMTLNNLLASPSFAAWAEGEPLDIASLLYGEGGRPKLSVLSISHLSESERMFFVTLLLGEIVAWMRSQRGSQSLRALVYMDEVFGYFPPTANPPSKQPMLTLLKQARAYGLGVVLATQNPVDLDYKGLANAGTWLLGRLQTERDKARVLEGLEGASASAGSGFDRGAMEQTLAGLGKRAFLMHNVHEDAPVVFKTRWALSYLAGPLTRMQLKQLSDMQPQKPASKRAKPAAVPAGRAGQRAAAAATEAAPLSPSAGDGEQLKRPVVAPEIEEAFLPVDEAPGAGEQIEYRPALAAHSMLHYVSAKAGVDEWRNRAVLAPLAAKGSGSPWANATLLGASLPDLESSPEEGARFGALPRGASSSKKIASWQKQLKTHLYREARLDLWRCKKPKLTSEPDEGEDAFRGRVAAEFRGARDLQVEKLRKRYTPKLATMQDRIARAEEKIEREEEQYKEKKFQGAISIGASLVGALFGRKLASAGNVGRATTAARSVGRAAREKSDIGRAEERLEQLREQMADLETQFEDDLAKLEMSDAEDVEIEEIEVAPRKADIGVERLVLAWVPWCVDAAGNARPATTV